MVKSSPDVFVWLLEDDCFQKRQHVTKVRSTVANGRNELGNVIQKVLLTSLGAQQAAGWQCLKPRKKAESDTLEVYEASKYTIRCSKPVGSRTLNSKIVNCECI
jgi:hypothetical protein